MVPAEILGDFIAALTDIKMTADEPRGDAVAHCKIGVR